MSDDRRRAAGRSRRSFLRGAAGVSGLAVGLTGCVAPRAGAPVRGRGAPTATAMFRGGLRRWGFEGGETVPDEVAVEWTLPDVNVGEHTAAKASFVRSPTGDLLLPGDDGVLRSVTPAGEVRWRAATDPSRRGIHGTPAVANGLAYIGAYDGALYAFDVETGERRWKTDLGDAIGSSPAYDAGTVYVAVEFATPSGALFAVDGVTGRVVARDDRPTDQPHSSIAIDREAGRLVFGANDGVLYAWDYPSLEFAWRLETGGPIKGPIAAYDGAAFFGSWDDHVYRVRLRDGRVEWTFRAGGDVMSGAAVDPRTATVYVGSHDANCYALDAETGAQRWAYRTGGWLIGCPTVTAERVLVGSYDANCYCLDRRTGREVWRVETHGRVTSTPLVVDGRVYYAERATEERGGAAYCLGPA